MSGEGVPLSQTRYRLTLGSGETVSGKTDSDGRTQRIKTAQPQVIKRVELFPLAAPSRPCGQDGAPHDAPRSPEEEAKRIDRALRCSLEETVRRAEAGQPARSVPLDDTTTNATGLGRSVATVTLDGEARGLTHGEITMAQQIFGRSIDYSRVKVHKQEYLPFGVQDDETAMTPNGEMYFNPTSFKEDYSLGNDDYKQWFMHEMVHVWQHQLGYPVTFKGLLLTIGGGYNRDNQRATYDYDAVKDAGKTLSDFNMEQQGKLIADYFATTALQHSYHEGDLAFLRQVLADFLRNPKNAALLPK